MECARCGMEAMKKFKYCKSCKKVVIAEMEAAAYLQKTSRGHEGDDRPPEAKENIYETKRGVDR